MSNIKTTSVYDVNKIRMLGCGTFLVMLKQKKGKGRVLFESDEPVIMGQKVEISIKVIGE